MIEQFHILVTNDDGPESPLLLPFLDEVKKQPWCRSVQAVVPAQEKSWIAQAMSRFHTVFPEEHQIGEHSVYFVNGTPADCVALGIEFLCRETPTLVLSGINMGSNAGLAFYFSSGTVGGARLAALMGFRAVALSVAVPHKLFESWCASELQELAQHNGEWQRIAQYTVRQIGNLLDDGCWNGVDLYSLNAPWDISENSQCVLTQLERNNYLSLFKKEGKGFRHHFQGFRELKHPQEYASDLGSDIEAVQNGNISLSPIRYELAPRGTLQLRQLLSTKEKAT